MGDLATCFCADTVLLEVCCAQLTETPISPPGEPVGCDGIDGVLATAALVDSLLVPAVRELHRSLTDHVGRLSELLELLPYLHVPGPPSASAQIHATLREALRGDHAQQLNLREIRTDLRRATLRLTTPSSPERGGEMLQSLSDCRAELRACAAEPQRQPRLRVAWVFERTPDGGRCHHPSLTLLPPSIAPFVARRPVEGGCQHTPVPVRWVSEVVASLKQTLAWLDADVVALEAAWVSSAAELKASIAAIDWSPSDRLRANTQLQQQLSEAVQSLSSCTRAFRWLLHFDALALIHPLPATARG